MRYLMASPLHVPATLTIYHGSRGPCDLLLVTLLLPSRPIRGIQILGGTVTSHEAVRQRLGIRDDHGNPTTHCPDATPIPARRHCG